MTPLPARLGGTELVAWRLDEKTFEKSWDSGEGARLYGGRWNSRGRKIVYCSIDPATAIVEVAVHKGFKILDTVPHVLTSALMIDPTGVHIVQPGMVPNANWLRPGFPSAGQQAFGDALLSTYPFVLIPSVVSTHSWNLMFDPAVAKNLYSRHTQEDFALDTRLQPPHK
ncbi:MAG: RES family NAD+ phosphorylase [Pyrinomonadaceae bacterium]